jgi:hypothetical protein
LGCTEVHSALRVRLLSQLLKLRQPCRTPWLEIQRNIVERLAGWPTLRFTKGAPKLLEAPRKNVEPAQLVCGDPYANVNGLLSHRLLL